LRFYNVWRTVNPSLAPGEGAVSTSREQFGAAGREYQLIGGMLIGAAGAMIYAELSDTGPEEALIERAPAGER
jgi:hypothetical protein